MRCLIARCRFPLPARVQDLTLALDRENNRSVKTFEKLAKATADGINLKKDNFRLTGENRELTTALRNLNGEYQELKSAHEKAMANKKKVDEMVDEVDQKFQDVVVMSKWYKERVRFLEERLLLD